MSKQLPDCTKNKNTFAPFDTACPPSGYCPSSCRVLEDEAAEVTSNFRQIYYTGKVKGASCHGQKSYIVRNEVLVIFKLEKMHTCSVFSDDFKYGWLLFYFTLDATITPDLQVRER